MSTTLIGVARRFSGGVCVVGAAGPGGIVPSDSGGFGGGVTLRHKDAISFEENQRVPERTAAPTKSTTVRQSMRSRNQGGTALSAAPSPKRSGSATFCLMNESRIASGPVSSDPTAIHESNTACQLGG